MYGWMFTSTYGCLQVEVYKRVESLQVEVYKRVGSLQGEVYKRVRGFTS